jgi:hypothetical protein
MKIAIYGDSFGIFELKNFPGDDVDRGKGWVELFPQDWSVTNYCQAGSSIFYSYKNYLQYGKNYDKNIFLITEPSRITLPVDQLELLAPGFKDRNNSHMNFNTLRQLLQTSVDDVPAIRKIYESAYDYYTFIKNDETVYCNTYAMLKDLISNKNTILIPCFETSMPDFNSPWHSTPTMGLADTFEWFKHPNITIANMHIKDSKRWGYFDYKKCHLSEENNLKLFNLVMKAIDNNTSIINLKDAEFIGPTKPLEWYYIRRNFSVAPSGAWFETSICRIDATEFVESY